jgi:hypothetical protein
MKKPKIEKFSLMAISDALSRLDVCEARLSLLSAVGAVLQVSGRVRKLVKRDERYGLVIEPDDQTALIVFADCRGDAENVETRKIRKGSLVSIRGKFQTFGREAVCLIDCRLLMPEGRFEQVRIRKQRKNKESLQKFALKKEEGSSRCGEKAAIIRLEKT